MKILTITNSEGRKFNINIVLEGEAYGLNNSLTHDKSEPLVEFYDATYQGKGEFGPLGQFTGGRYYLRSLKKHEKGYGNNNGLQLDGGVSAWKITADNLQEVLTFADNYIRERLEVRTNG